MVLRMLGAVAALLLVACSSGSSTKPNATGAAGRIGAAGAAGGAAGSGGGAGTAASDGGADATSDAPGVGPVLAAPVVLARVPGCGAAHLTLAGTHVFWTELATGLVKSLAVTDAGGTP